MICIKRERSAVLGWCENSCNLFHLQFSLELENIPGLLEHKNLFYCKGHFWPYQNSEQNPNMDYKLLQITLQDEE